MNIKLIVKIIIEDVEEGYSKWFKIWEKSTNMNCTKERSHK